VVFHEEWMKQSIISFKDAFGDHFVQGRVSNIDFETKKVFLEDTDKTIEYTDVVFAVGNDGPFPGTPQSNTMEVLSLNSQLEGQYASLFSPKNSFQFHPAKFEYFQTEKFSD
jgi:NADH dehydrogenase FAD-containing subunit